MDDAAMIWRDALRDTLGAYRKQVEGAVVQLTDEELFRRPAPGANSVAVILRHLGGNLRSRWTDFFTTDGEKHDRHRDAEFEEWPGDRESLLAYFDEGWALLTAAVEQISDENLGRRITVRGEEHTLPLAFARSVMHVASHVGQIVYLARLVHQGEWNWLSIPPGGSEAFNSRTWGPASSRADDSQS